MSNIDDFKELTTVPASTQVLFIEKRIIKELAKKRENPLLQHIVSKRFLCWSDLYKFILQGTCGWTHLQTMTDLSEIKKWLIKELKEAGTPRREEKLFEILNHTTGIGRVNLRYWKRDFSTDHEPIWTMMRKIPAMPNLELFRQKWEELNRFFDDGILHADKNILEIKNWLSFIHSLSYRLDTPGELPGIRHSELYSKKFFPSYRLIIQKDLIEFLEKKQLLKRYTAAI
ncbi:MAG: hypothetical protein ACTSP4_14625 [Candidatus Hodarchaeales archaeon]